MFKAIECCLLVFILKRKDTKYYNINNNKNIMNALECRPSLLHVIVYMIFCAHDIIACIIMTDCVCISGVSNYSASRQESKFFELAFFEVK